MKRKIFILVTLIAICLGVNAQEQKESNVITLTKAEFIKKVGDINGKEFKYKGNKPAIVDFYADWCGPCRKLSPILEEIAAEQKGKVYIYKVNTDKDPEIARAFGIRALPTLIFFPKKGEHVKSEGFLPKTTIEENIKTHLLKNKK